MPKSDQSSKQAQRSTAHVEIAYSGPPGTMDAEDLAPALLGISALCKRANELFNGTQATVSVNVRSDFKTASFGIDLDVIQTLTTGLAASAPLFTPENFKSATELAELIGLVTVGDEKAFPSLLGLIKWLRGSKVEKLEKLPTPDKNVFRVTNESGDNITITGDVGQLIINPSVREAAHQALKPLERPQITGFQIKEEGKVVQEVPNEALAFFHLEDAVPTLEVVAEEVLSDSTSRRAFEVIRPSFDPTLMWKMSDGERHFDMHVDDEMFRERVTRGEFAFRAGTAVVGLYRFRSVRGANGKIHTEYRLVTMIDVRDPQSPANNQLFS